MAVARRICAKSPCLYMRGPRCHGELLYTTSLSCQLLCSADQTFKRGILMSRWINFCRGVRKKLKLTYLKNSLDFITTVTARQPFEFLFGFGFELSPIKTVLFILFLLFSRWPFANFIRAGRFGYEIMQSASKIYHRSWRYKKKLNRADMETGIMCLWPDHLGILLF